jgi:chromosome segregation ATPase
MTPPKVRCKETNVWNSDSLKEYFDAQFKELEKRLDNRFDTAERTTESTRQAMEKRLDNLNELRAMVTDRDATFVTKEVLDTRMTAMDERIGSLAETRAEQKGKDKQIQLSWGQLTTGALILVGVLGLIFKLLGMY